VRNRLLLLVDVLLLAVAAWLGIDLYRTWTAPPQPGAATRARTGDPASSPSPAPPARPEPSPFSAFAVVAERNLFSPTRNEVAAEPPRPAAPATPVAPPAPPAPKPRLYGVVLGGESGRAYLEDPRTRKVFPYRVGDAVADSRLERIDVDRVVMRRGSEVYEVLLRDPTKPRPAPAPPAPAVPRPGAGAPPGTPLPTPQPGAVPGSQAVPAPTGARAPGAGVQRPPVRVPAPEGPVTPARPDAQEPAEDEPQ
jgi:hypothetical protein